MIQRRSRGCWEPAGCLNRTRGSLQLNLRHNSSTFTLMLSFLLLLLQTDKNHGFWVADESLFSRLHVHRWGNQSQSLAGIFLLLHTPGLNATRQGINFLDDEIHITNFFWGLMTNKVWKQQDSSGYCILLFLFSVSEYLRGVGLSVQCQGCKKALEEK